MLGEKRTTIREVRQRLGLSQIDFAKRLNVKQSMMSAYETGSAEVPREVIERLFDFFNVNLNWLYGKSRYIFNDEAEAHDNAGIVWVELVGDLLSEGGFQVISTAPVLKEFVEPFKKNEVRAHIINGDNMEPFVFAGDCVFFVPGRCDDDGVYIMSVNKRLVCRRLEFCFDGTINVLCDNSRYSKQTITADSGHVNIIGRVISVTKRVR